MENKNNNLINIVAQAFYGNRINTSVNKDDIDRFILGYLSNDIKVTEPINRTVVAIPSTDNIVIVYNKYEEEKKRNLKEDALAESNYVIKPLVVIPELNIELYSRCIACRMREDGELESLQNGDYEKIIKYFTE